MHIFRINIWWMLLVFTLPALLFSQNPYIISILYFIFFALYFFQLSKINKSKKGILLRNKLECILLLIIFRVYPLSILFDKQISLSESLKTIFSILYFLIFIDLSFGFISYFLANKKEYHSVGKRVLIFLCLLVPPLGFYYLRFLYNNQNN